MSRTRDDMLAVLREPYRLLTSEAWEVWVNADRFSSLRDGASDGVLDLHAANVNTATLGGALGVTVTPGLYGLSTSYAPPQKPAALALAGTGWGRISQILQELGSDSWLRVLVVIR